MQLDGKVALVTGAGSGLGKAAAIRLAREGASVGILSRTQSEIDLTVAEIVKSRWQGGSADGRYFRCGADESGC